MLDYLISLDSQLFLLLNGLHSPFTDAFMYGFSGRFVWIPMYACILWLLIRNRPLKIAAVYLAGIILAIVFADQVCASLIRPAVERLRPSNLDNSISALTHIVYGYRGGSYGFPSCHAANSFALAVFISRLFRRRWFSAFILLWAVVNSYSRICLGVHFPGDLLAGAIIGSIGAEILFRVSRHSSLRIDPGERDAMHMPFQGTNVMIAIGLATTAAIAIFALFRMACGC